MSTHLHIISFDVPFPANYGGIIDVYHKIRWLHKKNCKIILHCFDYGRGTQPELENICYKVYYYKRIFNLLSIFSTLPFIVKSRTSQELLINLTNDDYPILFEGLHTCFLLNHPSLKNRIKIYRESNIEHEYYKALAQTEKNQLKKIYFQLEARKLKKFEPVVLNSQLVLTVSQKDTAYFQTLYPSLKTEYLPSFHANDTIQSKAGKGDFVLFHGKLSVNENHAAAMHLVENIFCEVKTKVVIAGMNPKEELVQKIAEYPHIELITNPDEESMENLISNAHINCLFTHQETGLKLKLIHSLFSGRFVLCNQKIVFGTGLDNMVVLAHDDNDFIEKIKALIKLDFTSYEIQSRSKNMPLYYLNNDKADRLIEIIQSLKN